MKKELEKLPGNIYKKLTNELYDGVYFVNRERRIIFWNRQAAALTGYRKKEILGKHCYKNILQHIDRHGRQLCLTKYCPLLISMKTGKPCKERVYLKRKDGLRLAIDVHTKPIKYQGRIIGAAEVFRDASAYERVEKQRERAKIISLTDALTSLPNRRYINRKMELELNKFRKYKEDLYIAVVDIDHFKRINDVYGHKTGDLALKRLAYILEHNLRPSDFVGRYGGEEFLIILPHTSPKDAPDVLERLRKAVENSRILNKKGQVTISIGAAKTKLRDKAEVVFKQADQVLYKAKRDGRNRVEFAGS
jgi:diguanylate cyclase (GGDEF)-like protein/PAS domain S-box-containing protein